MDKFIYSNANITSMRIIDPNNPIVRNIMAEWGVLESNNAKSPLNGKRGIMVSIMFTFSSVSLSHKSYVYKQFLDIAVDR